MIKACYLIFSHDWQPQLARLATTISRLSPNSLVVIHHDPTKGPIKTGLFSGIDNLHIVPAPVPGRWGQYSLVEQQLHALRYCLTKLEWDWIITISGQSYPLQPLADFEQMLASAPYDAFVRHFDALAEETWISGLLPRGEGQRRYLYFYIGLPRFAYYYLLPGSVVRALATLRRRFNQSQQFVKIVPMPGRSRIGIRRLLKRPLGASFQLCVGRPPLQMNRHACEYVLTHVDNNPSYAAYFKTTLIPDEGFFTSLLANAPHLRIKNDALRYIKWNRGEGASRGAVISFDEVPQAVRSGKPFGLKFDMDSAPEALELLDDLLKIRTGSPETVPVGSPP